MVELRERRLEQMTGGDDMARSLAGLAIGLQAEPKLVQQSSTNLAGGLPPHKKYR